MPNATTWGRAVAEMPAHEQTTDGVADRHADDGERTEDLALGLRSDEQGDAGEPDAHADERPSRDPLLVEEPERDHAR